MKQIVYHTVLPSLLLIFATNIDTTLADSKLPKNDFRDIWEAAAQGNVKDVESFINNGVDVNTKNRIGSTPLCFTPNLEVAQFLVENGADVNARNSDGRTPLHSVKNLEVAKFLVEKGADINAKSNDGKTPLHYCCWFHRDLATIKFLVEKGADVNAKDRDGRTPLHFVTRSLEVVKFLVKKGADINAKTNDGKTPLQDTYYGGKKPDMIVQFFAECEAHNARKKGLQDAENAIRGVDTQTDQHTRYKTVRDILRKYVPCKSCFGSGTFRCSYCEGKGRWGGRICKDCGPNGFSQIGELFSLDGGRLPSASDAGSGVWVCRHCKGGGTTELNKLVELKNELAIAAARRQGELEERYGVGWNTWPPEIGDSKWKLP